MIVLTSNFNDKSLRYATVSENGVLFNTIDVCRILRILKRPPNGSLSRSCLNISEVIEAALSGGRCEMAFVDWVELNFIGYDIFTATAVECDGDWRTIR